MKACRIGSGFDVHRLVAGRPLKLGGVTLPYDRGLDGHSDADVLLHAICDAILGALGQGDIGRHFPDDDPAYKDADSRNLLRTVWQRATAAGYEPGHVDAIVVAETPRIAPPPPQMAANIPADRAARPRQGSVKATPGEGLGFTGRGEGIAAWATVLLVTA